MVIAIIAILAALLLPALYAGKAKGQQTACENNLKQLVVCWIMYSADNDTKLVVNVPFQPAVPTINSNNNWTAGNMMNVSEATNALLLRQGEIFPYVSQTAVYHCPADVSQTNGMLRVRSYSMNGWIGSRDMNNGLAQAAAEPSYQSFVKEAEMAAKGTSSLWVFMDEHESTIDDPWFLVTMDDSRPFASFPATRHRQGYNLSFADGHVEHYALRDPTTQSPTKQVSAQNSDWLRLKLVTTLRWGQ